jgi:hypothetical protein
MKSWRLAPGRHVVEGATMKTTAVERGVEGEYGGGLERDYHQVVVDERGSVIGAVDLEGFAPRREVDELRTEVNRLRTALARLQHHLEMLESGLVL